MTMAPAAADGLTAAAERDLWAGAVMLRGALPQFPNIASLPTAAVSYRGKVAAVLGAAGAADVLYLCMKSAADTYSWKAIVTG